MSLQVTKEGCRVVVCHLAAERDPRRMLFVCTANEFACNNNELVRTVFVCTDRNNNELVCVVFGVHSPQQQRACVRCVWCAQTATTTSC